MSKEELNILSKIKVRPVEEQRNYLLEQNMLLTGKIATLEKENAELKGKYDTCLRENTGLKIHSAYVEKQFTTAKEIIKKLKALYFSPVETKDDVKRQNEILLEAEQFLKETEQ